LPLVESEETQELISEMVDVYAIASYLQATKLKNCVIEEILATAVSASPGITWDIDAIITKVYAEQAGQSPLKRLLIDTKLHALPMRDAKAFRAAREEIHPNFVFDVATRFLEVEKIPDPHDEDYLEEDL
ncbi:hypothetical protein LTS18_007319, partial [Coniosporium uncinatum]